MSAAMLIGAWSDTMLVTALLVLAVMLVRKPFARHFGPRLTYALWLIPVLRLLLPPLPVGDLVSVSSAAQGVPADAVLVEAVTAARTMGAPVATSTTSWTFSDALPLLFGLWAAGAVAVLALALVRHHRFRTAVLDGAVELEPLGTIRLVMTDAVDGPVAFGLWRRVVAVPHDFFARYVADERALAIDHELAHHRHGDLWANAAALMLLSAQWFNPVAWRALRAFRFDQEAACDARVLTMTDAAPRDVRTARYATAIAKAAVGARLSLAAPMAVHDNLQERLTMLMQKDISRMRGRVGKLLVGGAALAVLATTATIVPAGIAGATTQDSDFPAPPAPPSPPDAPLPPEAPAVSEGQRVMIVTTEQQGGEHAAKDGAKREVHRVIVRDSGDHADTDAPTARRIAFAMPGSLSRDDILATLKEQGISGARADAIADKLEARREQRFTATFAPIPPMPPLPPMPAGNWASVDGKAMAFAHCGSGAASAPIVDRDEKDGNRRSHVVMIRCTDTPESRAARVAALKKARDGFAKAEAARGLSDAMRAKVAADLDKAIADAEKSTD